MKRLLFYSLVCMGLIGLSGDVSGRGFGGFGGGGFRGGSFGGMDRAGGFSGSYGRSFSDGYGHGFSSFSGADRFGGSYSGSRSTESFSGWGGRGASGSYDHSWTDAAGGSISTSGTRGIAEGRYGGIAAGGTRDTTVTTASGKTYSADRQGGFASGPMGRTVGGASGAVDGRYGTSSWETAFSGNRYTGNMNHYASVYGANGAHSTAYWSTGYMGARAGYVRTGFGYYGCFYPGWYAVHPGCWAAAGWAAGAAWAAPSYGSVASYCGMAPDESADYDYGSSVVYQNNNVYVNGQDAGTAEQYAQQATNIATQGQNVDAPPTDEWKALGVFALVQGDEKTSNNIFQLAVNKDGIIRGNYYDGLMDTTTPVYGSVDKKSQRVAWTIGKKADRVFEAGIYNLTQAQCPCLLHVGTQTTDQMLLVRMEQPKTGN
jgi:hypothetical protein